MKLTLRIYLAVLASLLLFVISILLLGVFLGGHEKREYTEQVARTFEQEILPKLDLRYIDFIASTREYNFREHDEFDKPPEHKRHQDWHDGVYDNNKRDDHHHKPLERERSSRLSEHSNQYAKQDPREIRQIWQKNREMLREFTKNNHASIVIVSPQGEPLRRIGRRPPNASLFKRFSNNNMVVVALPHRLNAHIRTHNPNIAFDSFVMRFLVGLGIMFLCVGLISYPIARRISKRLNTLTASVNGWGENGSTQLNLPDGLIEGKDEIAELSQSFSSASQRIDELLQANKLLLANASHEIRTPLTRIRLNMEMLENVVDASKQDDYKKRETAIKRNLTELDELVENILQTSRLDAQDGLVNATSIDLYDLVKQEAQHYPDINLTGESVDINGQENLLIQLIRNLIGNAYKHGKPPVSASVTIENKHGKKQAVFTVTDAGGGIPEDKLDEIFTPFKRLSNNTKGNGLGLHLVKKIVELHGGDIQVSSHTGKTTFNVSLPI